MQAAELVLALTVLAAGLGLAGWASHRALLPPALGYLVIGVLASPAIAATPTIDPHLLEPAVDIAVLVLLFFIGLELNLSTLRRILRQTGVVSVFNVVVPTLLVAAAVRLVGWSTREAVVLGLALAMSSTLFGERLTGTRGFPLKARERALGVLLAEDVAAVALIALLAILGDPSTTGAAGLLGPAWAVGRLVFLFVLLTAVALLIVPWLLDKVARTHSLEILVLMGVAVVLAFAWGGAMAGSAELGALMAGVAAAEAGSRFVVRNGLASVRALALAVFFVGAGLATDIGAIVQHPALVLGLAGVVLVAKLVVHVPAGIGAGLNLRESLQGALALGTVGEFSLIMAAAAAATGIAHPLTMDVVVGSLLILLMTSPVLLRLAPRITSAVEDLPSGIRRPFTLFVKSVHASSDHELPAHRLRPAIRALVANLVLLLGWVLVAVTAGPFVVRAFPERLQDFAGPVAVFGLAAAVAGPLVVFTYRRYRAVVWLLVNRPGQAAGASNVRARLVDAWVALTATLLLVPVTLLVPRTLPVLLGGLFLAIIIGTVAWRKLSGFHEALEGTVERVLGQDPEMEALLDRVMEDYPWGVRFAAVGVPPDSPVANRTVRDSRITELTGATVAVLQRNRREVVNPAPDLLLHGGDTLVLMGDAVQLARAEALVVAHGEALRMTAQSRLARIAEATVREGSELVGVRLDASDVRGRTGTIVVGLWPKDGRHPVPYRDELVPRPGDRLIVLGAPLQVERVRLLAEGQEYAETVESDGVPPPGDGGA